MPAKSKSQQRFMGMVHALQKGELSPSDVSDKVKDVADRMDDSDAEDYASTKHSGKPEHVPKEVVGVARKLREMIRQIIKENPSFIEKFKLKKEVAKRDYKAEYKKFQSSDKAKKYRAELNQYNRKKGTYGNGDGKDASHKGGKIVGFESQSKNRGRAEKSRLKKEVLGKRCTVKEISKWLKTLEEFRYRKVRGVDARRVASFVNSGMNEEELPISLQKKWEHKQYGREKHLANKYVETVLNVTLKEFVNEGRKASKAYNEMNKAVTTAIYGIKNMRKLIDDAPYNPKIGAISANLYKFEIDLEKKLRKFIPQIRVMANSKMLESVNEKTVQTLGKVRLSSIQKKAILIAMQMFGNMTGAVKKIEKLKTGLSKDKAVAAALRFANESVNESVEPRGNIKKVLDVAKNKQARKIGGTLVDGTTANMMTQVWDKVNDKSKEKMNKMNTKQLIRLILKLWDRMGTPRV